MKTQMFKAVDRKDNKESLFAISGNRMAVSDDFGDDDSWLDQDSFGELSQWCTETLDESRMINPDLVWEK